MILAPEEQGGFKFLIRNKLTFHNYYVAIFILVFHKWDLNIHRILVAINLKIFVFQLVD